MNNKEVAKLIPVIQAFLEGKTIERKTRNWEFNKGWRDATQWEETEELKLRNTFVYRIKPEPEPKYRPFKNAEECLKEMSKHTPFGLIKKNIHQNFKDITTFKKACEALKLDYNNTKVKEALNSASYLTYHWRQYSFEQLEKEMTRVCALCTKALIFSEE